MKTSNRLPRAMGGPDIASLRTTLGALSLAYDAASGCKPNEQQVNEIARLSGAAVTSIMMALAATCKSYSEAQH